MFRFFEIFFFTLDLARPRVQQKVLTPLALTQYDSIRYHLTNGLHLCGDPRGKLEAGRSTSRLAQANILKRPESLRRNDYYACVACTIIKSDPAIDGQGCHPEGVHGGSSAAPDIRQTDAKCRASLSMISKRVILSSQDMPTKAKRA